jgi:tRNA U34 5-carboxymethylaminomethyl modifying GTPase MnmE/TrmE
VLFVIDAVADPAGAAYREERAQLPADVPVTLVLNKCDLAAAQGAKVRAPTIAAECSAAEVILADAHRAPPLAPGNEATVREIAAGDFSHEQPPPRLHISALTGAGIEELRAHLKGCMGFQTVEGGAISARLRHLESLARARGHVEEAARQLTERRAGELVAEELRAAQRSLDEITGEFTSDDLLGRIFSSFCIGK